jgi:hypothetical protein
MSCQRKVTQLALAQAAGGGDEEERVVTRRGPSNSPPALGEVVDVVPRIAVPAAQAREDESAADA